MIRQILAIGLVGLLLGGCLGEAGRRPGPLAQQRAPRGADGQVATVPTRLSGAAPTNRQSLLVLGVN